MVEAAGSSDSAAELPGSAGLPLGWAAQPSDSAVDSRGFAAAAAAAAAEGRAAWGSGTDAGSGGWELQTGSGEGSGAGSAAWGWGCLCDGILHWGNQHWSGTLGFSAEGLLLNQPTKGEENVLRICILKTEIKILRFY